MFIDHINTRFVDVENVSKPVLEQNLDRVFVRFMNDSDTTIYLSIGKPAVAHEGIMLGKGEGLTCERIRFAKMEAIHGKQGMKRLLIVEGT